MYFPNRINICEVGPRDGLQNEGVILKATKKAELINMCIDAGYKEIEIGSFVHPKAVPALADTEEVFRLINYKKNVDLRALVTNKKGVERAIIAGVHKIKLTVSASNSHNISNFNKDTEETLQDFKECYELAKVNDLFVSGAISTSFGCPFEGKIGIEKIEKIVIRLIEIGILEISLSDTTGMANPKEVYSKCKYFKEKYTEVKWNLHFHNTRDMGMVNILAAMKAGMENFDSAFSGLGGCPFAPAASGNVCSEDLIHMCEEIGIETGVDLDKAIDIAKRIEKLVGHKTDSYILKAGKIKDLVIEKPNKQN
ncbi:MAG: hydroxymethylglutaryl-CoA lyase [Eubacteriaceae bacterium]